MSRKLILIPALLFGAALLLNSSSASAHPPAYHHDHHRYPIATPIVYPVAPLIVPTAMNYSVVYRSNCTAPWQTFNWYNSQAYALDIANSLQLQGYEAQVWVR
jgi:hypothetical protein